MPYPHHRGRRVGVRRLAGVVHRTGQFLGHCLSQPQPAPLSRGEAPGQRPGRRSPEAGSLLAYKKAVQQAFQEVSDALVAVRRLREVRKEAERQVQALSRQTELAYQRYFGGVTPYLEMVDSDRDLFEAELRLTQVRANELLAVIALYRALGGGWQTEGASGTATSSPGKK